jgi:glycosyltransferase involved in cell wall biosynthesis
MANYHPFVVSGWGSDILIEPHKSLLRRTQVNYVLRRCDELTVPSQLLYNEAKTLGFPDSQLHLIPWGVETDVFKPKPDDGLATRERLGIEPESQVLFCPRSISPLYNIDIIAKAVKALIPYFNKLRIVLLQFSVNSRYLTKLQHLITKNDLEEFILWLPPQKSSTDMARLYRMADVTVSIPSSEGYGFSVYEAMASGCPTVITDLPVFSYELQNRIHTLKVPVRDPNSTSEALRTLLINHDLRREIIRNARRISQDKSVQRRESESIALYQKVVRSCNT